VLKPDGNKIGVLSEDVSSKSIMMTQFYPSKCGRNNEEVEEEANKIIKSM